MSVSGNVGGNSLCALGDAAIGPVRSVIKTFRPEVDRHIAEHGCPFPERRFFAEGA
jgi:NADH-quinone oxidoreductase subunit F